MKHSTIAAILILTGVEAKSPRKQHTLQREIELNASGADLSTDDIPIFELTAVPTELQEKALLPQLVWTEVNILALPFAVLDEREARTSNGHELIKFDKTNGKHIVWLWRVWPDPNVGMPTMATLRVLFALMDLADEARKLLGHQPYRIEFSLSDLCKRIGFTADGRHRAMVKRHIEILLSTQCKSKGAFKDKDRNGLYLDTFRYIRQAGFVGDIGEDGKPLEKSFVVFDDPIRMNLEAKYIKQIDVALMRTVKSPIGQLLYTKVSHWLHEAQKRGYDYVDVSYTHVAERMGIKVYDQLFRAKAQLKQAFSELVDLHYIKQPIWNGWTIRFEPGVRYEFGEKAPRQERKKAAKKAGSCKSKQACRPPLRISLSADDLPRDPLLPLCSLYASQGWKLAEAQAKRHNLTDQQLRAECIKRGLLTDVT